MPWHALDMRTRGLVLALVLAALTGCSGDDDGGGVTDPTPTTDAACAERIPDGVFETLGWSAPRPAEATVRGCHRETDQGYVEVRDRTDGDYAKLCRTLDRSGGVAPGVPADWLTGSTGCAVEPTGEVGQTKVLVKGDHVVTLVTVAVLASTPQAQVRAAVQQLLDQGVGRQP
jgi:hypothetical protein